MDKQSLEGSALLQWYQQFSETLAHYPGVEIRYIKGLKSKADADEWLQGSRRIDWLRSQGYAK